MRNLACLRTATAAGRILAPPPDRSQERAIGGIRAARVIVGRPRAGAVVYGARAPGPAVPGRAVGVARALSLEMVGASAPAVADRVARLESTSAAAASPVETRRDGSEHRQPPPSDGSIIDRAAH